MLLYWLTLFQGEWSALNKLDNTLPKNSANFNPIYSTSQFPHSLDFSTIITEEFSKTTTNNRSDCEGNVACSFPSSKMYKSLDSSGSQWASGIHVYGKTKAPEQW